MSNPKNIPTNDDRATLVPVYIFLGVAAVLCATVFFCITYYCCHRRHNALHGTHYGYWECMWFRSCCCGDPHGPTIAQHQQVRVQTIMAPPQFGGGPTTVAPYQYNLGHVTGMVPVVQQQCFSPPYNNNNNNVMLPSQQQVYVGRPFGASSPPPPPLNPHFANQYDAPVRFSEGPTVYGNSNTMTEMMSRQTNNAMLPAPGTYY